MLTENNHSDRYGQWFREARFGMFIHFGLYALLGRGEWVMFREGIRIKEYEKLAAQFNPVKCNARDWVTLAKLAGQNYITLTAKHHEGFCLFDSKLTDYKITNTPFGRDLLGELVEECHQQEMPLFFYYSLMDWHHPDYQNSLKKGAPIPIRFIDYLKGHLTELCTNYGKIAGIWFDGDWDHTAEQWHSQELIELIYRLQPHALVNNRLGGLKGDFSTPEQSIASHKNTDSNSLLEACMTINDNWGYTPVDDRHKSSRELIQMLAMAAGLNTNLLLNVGPTPEGVIQPEHTERLIEIGKWLHKNGESIYKTRAANVTYLSNTSTTRSDKRFYFHVFNWEKDTRIRIDLDIREKIQWVYVLEDGAEIPYIKNVSIGEGLSASTTIALKNEKWNSIDAVIVVEVDA